MVLEEDASDPAADPADEPAFDIAPDLSLLDDEIASDDIDSGAFQGLDLDDIEVDEDSTIIQSDGLSDMDAELALLEDAIASGPDDEDITIIQNDGGVDPAVDLDEEITAIQPDDMPDLEAELALLEDAIAPINLDGAIDLDEVSAGLGEGTALGEPFLPEVEDLSLEGERPEDLSPEDLFSSEDGPLEDAPPEDISPENISPEDLSPDDESSSPTLELSLGDIDESLGLLAIGADGGSADSEDLQSLTDDVSEQDALPQIEAEGELFNFDADFDLGLEPRTPTDESIDLFEGPIFLDDPSDPITSDALNPADTMAADAPPSDVDGASLAESDVSAADQIADSW